MMALTPRLAILIDASGTKALGEFNKVTASSKALEDQTKKTNAAMANALNAPSARTAGLANAAQQAEFNKQTALGTAQQTLLGKAMLVTGGAALAGFGLAVKSAMSFDKAMSAVNATSDLSSKQFDSLRDAALSTGQQFGISATTAATAEQQLLKTGLSVADVLGGGLKNALALATAGSLDVGDAASIAAQAMNAFGLSGSDFAHVADVLAAGSNHSAASVSGLGDSITQVGPLAHQMGLSLDQTVGALDMFAQKGADAGDAGTALRQFLLKLAPTSKTAQDGMKELGLDMFDAQGNFIGLGAAADQLHKKFGALNQQQQIQALTTIFGARAAKSALPFVQDGAKAVDAATIAVSAQGAASDLASKKLDNLSGDFGKLGSAINTGLIKSADGATAPLRSVVQGVTGAVSGFASLPPVAQEVAGGVAGLGGAFLAAAGTAAVMIPKITAMRTSLEAMGAAGRVASAGIGALGSLGVIAGTIGAVAIGFNAVENALAPIRSDNIDKLTISLMTFAQTGQIGGEAAKIFGTNLDGLVDKANSLDTGIANVAQHLPKFLQGPDTVQASKDVDAFDKVLANMVTSGHAANAKSVIDALTASAAANGKDFSAVLPHLNDYHAALDSAGAAAASAGGNASGLSANLVAQGLTMDSTGNVVDSIGNKYDALGNKLLSASEQSDKLSTAVLNQISAQHSYGKALESIKTAQDNYNDKQWALNKLLQDGAVDEKAVASATLTHDKALASVTTASEKLTKAQIDLRKAQTAASPSEVLEAQDKITDSAIKQRDAQNTLADAIKKRDEIQKAIDAGPQAGKTDDIVIAQQNVTDSTKNYTKVLKNHKSTAGDIATAHKAMIDAQTALTDAQTVAIPTARDLQTAQDDVTEAQIGLDSANKAAEDSTTNLTTVLAKGSDADPAVQSARQGVADATTGLADANEAAKNADDALKLATAGDPDWGTKVAKARGDVRDATNGIKDAQWNAADSAINLRNKTDDEKTAFLTWGGSIDDVKTKLSQLQHDHPEIAGDLNPIFAALADLIHNTGGFNAQTGNFQNSPATILAHQKRAAQGGVFKSKPGGWSVNIGEGGQDEAVIPLDRFGGMNSGGGTSINITVNGALDPQSVAKQMDQILSRYNRGGNAAFLSN